MHDAQAIATLKQLFDGILEVKQEDDDHFIRVVGMGLKPSPWYRYTIEGANLVLIGGD